MLLPAAFKPLTVAMFTLSDFPPLPSATLPRCPSPSPMLVSTALGSPISMCSSPGRDRTSTLSPSPRARPAATGERPHKQRTTLSPWEPDVLRVSNDCIRGLYLEKSKVVIDLNTGTLRWEEARSNPRARGEIDLLPVMEAYVAHKNKTQAEVATLYARRAGYPIPPVVSSSPPTSL